MATSENIKRVGEITDQKRSEDQLVVVVSALGGVTNRLVRLSNLAMSNPEDVSPAIQSLLKDHLQVSSDLLFPDVREVVDVEIQDKIQELTKTLHGISLVNECSSKVLDNVLSIGELLSSFIIAHYLNQLAETQWLDMRKVIVTDQTFGNARVILKKTKENLHQSLKHMPQVVVCPGFIASSESGETSTLGRGGSDYTASLLASLLKADHLEIWTDVSGMMTADPRIVPRAKVINKITYEETMELSHFGAKVIYPPTIQPVLDAKIPLLIKNTFKPDEPGTWISQTNEETAQAVKGLTCMKNIALLNLKGPGMIGVPSFSFRLFKALSEKNINVILITQASSEHTICVGIDENDVATAEKVISNEFELELEVGKIRPVQVQRDLCIIALVGNHMKNQVGISGKLFSTLGTNGVNVIAIAQGSSERNISVVIACHDLQKALNSLHENFFLSEKKRLNLFIAGVGNVGGTLIDQIRNQYAALFTDHNLDLRVIGLANSKSMTFNPEGIDLENWKALLSEGQSMEAAEFILQMKELNLRNAVFIDCTASPELPGHYLEILQMSSSVVTPNKIACSSRYEDYKNLKYTAQKFGTRLLFETNVGAGLPIISTLNDLIKSGDQINEIHAVLSGSLNFIFNTYDGNTTFEQVVKLAAESGYTEPDPRIDLSGLDVKRKLLILIREAGIPCELEDIESQPFLPKECMDTATVEEFYLKLHEVEDQISSRIQQASQHQARLKYVARYQDHKASTCLAEINQSHPFYSLEGKDNIVLFYTKRYNSQPLVIKGAGAGAEVTASGIFADIIRVANS